MFTTHHVLSTIADSGDQSGTRSLMLGKLVLLSPDPQIIHVKDSIQCFLYSVLLQNLTTINLPVQIKKGACKGTGAWHYKEVSFLSAEKLETRSRGPGRKSDRERDTGVS